jgi:hypothetical protein
VLTAYAVTFALVVSYLDITPDLSVVALLDPSMVPVKRPDPVPIDEGAPIADTVILSVCSTEARSDTDTDPEARALFDIRDDNDAETEAKGLFDCRADLDTDAVVLTLFDAETLGDAEVNIRVTRATTPENTTDASVPKPKVALLPYIVIGAGLNVPLKLNMETPPLAPEK